MPTHLFQQLQLWKALDFIGKFFLLTVAKIFCIFLKPGLLKSCKDRKHMFANTSFKLFAYALVFTRADQNTGGALLKFPKRTAMHGKSRVSSAIYVCDN